ncbi:MAG: hypothetical protein NT027_17475 [Proteobacteria bacterium]|nr:hypothetical protein [Pseudomonadota bacterium]
MTLKITILLSIMALTSCRKTSSSPSVESTSTSKLGLQEGALTPTPPPGCSDPEVEQHRLRIQSAKNANAAIAAQIDAANMELALVDLKLQIAEYLALQAKIRGLWDDISENNAKIQTAQKALGICASVQHNLPIDPNNMNPACNEAMYRYAEAVRIYENAIAQAERTSLQLNSIITAKQTATNLIELASLVASEAYWRSRLAEDSAAVGVAAQPIRAAGDAMGIACKAPSLVGPSPSPMINPTSPAVPSPIPSPSVQPSPNNLIVPSTPPVTIMPTGQP